MMKDFRIFGLLLMLLAGLGSCSDDDDPIVEEPVAVESVALDQTTVTLIEGETLQLKATVSPDDAEYDGISWSTSDATIATVSNTGLVTAVTEGTVTITAEAGGKTASCALTIEKAKGPEVEKVTLNQETATLKEGETLQLAATVSPEDADYSGIIWSTADETIATVSEDGLVTAVLEGTVVITAQAGEQTAQCTITVERKPVLVSVEGDKAQIDLDAAQTTEEVVAALQDAAGQGVTRYVLSGEFDKLGFSAKVKDVATVRSLSSFTRSVKGNSRAAVNPADIDVFNPFQAVEKTVEEIDMSAVTGWPEVDVDGDMIPDGVKGVPAFAFWCWSDEYTSFTTLILPQEVEALGTYSISSYHLTHVEAPGVKTIGYYAFCDISIPSFDGLNVTEIKEGAFFACLSLTEVNLPNVSTIAPSAFMGCYALVSVGAESFPKVTKVENLAFYGCPALKTVELPEVIEVGKQAFMSCTALADVDLPKVKNIGEQAFYGCSALTNIDLPTVEEIGKSTFDQCPLTELDLPSATTIGVSFVSGEHLQTLKLTAPGVTLMRELTADGKGYYTSFSRIMLSESPNITLYLNADKQNEVLDGNSWQGYTWKEIIFE